MTTLDLSSYVLARFWKKVDKTGECWIWTGARSKGGYGTFNLGPVGGRRYRYALAHRLSYEIGNDPIPAGMQIDHLCRVRHCVNPAHMEVVTQRENILRGESPTAKHARRTHCQNGHPYDKTRPDGYRTCSICNAATWTRNNEKQRLLRIAERLAKAAA